MNGREFQVHRMKMLGLFRSHGRNQGTIFYKSPTQPKELYTGSELSFTQEALFYWMTGWDRPDSAIVIDLAMMKSILLIPEYNSQYEIWTGPIPTVEEIKLKTGVDEVRFMRDLESFVRQPIYTTSGQLHSSIPHDVATLLASAAISRRLKTQSEIEMLKRASVATSNALVEVMRNTKPNMNESDIEALFRFYGAKYGGKKLSFPTIAAGGKNAVYLHTRSNMDTLNDGDLLLVDCGVFMNHYAGDITRTFPINGKFSSDQRLVYSLLLKLQKSLIQKLRPGMTFSIMNDMMWEGIYEILQALNIVSHTSRYSRDVATLFCPHSLSHHLGCNVHDLAYSNLEGTAIPDNINNSRTLAPNMVITAEPGIYFHRLRLERARHEKVYSSVDIDLALKFADSVGGIRIEDDLLITHNVCEVLSTCPKEIEDIESIMSK